MGEVIGCNDETCVRSHCSSLSSKGCHFFSREQHKTRERRNRGDAGRHSAPLKVSAHASTDQTLKHEFCYVLAGTKVGTSGGVSHPFMSAEMLNIERGATIPIPIPLHLFDRQ